MKRKIANVVELVVYVVALIVLFTMKGNTEYMLNGNLVVHEGVNLVQDIKNVPIYPILLVVFWGLGMFLCVLSIISKSSKKDGLLHVLLPIVTLIITDMCLLGMVTSTPNFFMLNGLMFAIIIISIVKRVIVKE